MKKSLQELVQRTGGRGTILDSDGNGYIIMDVDLFGGGNNSNHGPFPDQLRHPLVQRHALRLGSRSCRLMDAGVEAQNEFAGMPFERLDSFFLAHLKEHLERNLAFMLQPGDVLGVKIRAAVQPDELAAKHLDVRVVFDHRPLPFNHHHIFHGLIPLFSSHLRIDSTAPLSVSGDGCGRWNTRTSPNSFTPMRDPSRSLTLAPKSISSDSTSRHLMLPEAGRAKISARVFELLRFMPEQYHKTVSAAMRWTVIKRGLKRGQLRIISGATMPKRKQTLDSEQEMKNAKT